MAKLRPALRIYGEEHIPSAGPCLVTVNHYNRPGFRAWWLALAVSAALPFEVHWIITGAWTFPGRPGARYLKEITRWAFTKVANVYAFTSMPPMPPDPAEMRARAGAVRRVLAYARQENQAAIGLAPEGRDCERGALGRPPDGVGRFMLHLAGLGSEVLPVGAFEEGDGLCLRFGAPYRLVVAAGLSPAERDRRASLVVMRHIAEQLPAHLRGSYAEEKR